MPIYEYACHTCKRFVEVITRRVSDDFQPHCPRCNGTKLTRMVSSFSFHQSFQSKLEQLDPKYDKMIEASNPDLSFDNLVKKYALNRPMSTPEERKKFKESGSKGLIP
ncbi:MAG: zinc ribbon domain-containing protein [Chloroflexota bacterium]|nr:zinc ribbon domain-containing protein [Chloroflexota bacterium]